MDIRHLKTLRMIRECGNMAAAAKRLHLTQSALSHQLKAIENQYDSELFARKSRPLQFTALGRRLLALADEILPRIELADKDIARILSGNTGRLHIVIECHSCFDWLMPTMDQYRDAWPDVEMDLSLVSSFEPLPALLNGDIDLVITSDPDSNTDIAYFPLFRYQSVVILNKKHPLLEKDVIEPPDFRDQTLISYPVDRRRLDIFSRFLMPAAVEPEEIRHAELTSMIVQLVANRRGISVLPSWAVSRYVEENTVQARPLGQDGLWGTLYAAVRNEQKELPYIKAFLACAKNTSAQSLDAILDCEEQG
ncbi:MAG: LysR family transcriptional regulator [Gammaproteobacteria bacterium]